MREARILHVSVGTIKLLTINNAMIYNDPVSPREATRRTACAFVPDLVHNTITSTRNISTGTKTPIATAMEVTNTRQRRDAISPLTINTGRIERPNKVTTLNSTPSDNPQTSLSGVSDIAGVIVIEHGNLITKLKKSDSSRHCLHLPRRGDISIAPP